MITKMTGVQQDLKRYIGAKEYIYTIIMPLITFQISTDEADLKAANQHQTITIRINEIEKELSGRVMLGPNYYYIKTADKENEVHRLNTWIDDMAEQPFKHYFFITSDLSWKKHEKNLNSELLLLPGIQSGDIH